MMSYNHNISQGRSDRHATFAAHWIPGAHGAGKSLRRRIMAALRASCMELGMKRRDRGIGLLGFGAGRASAALIVGGVALSFNPAQAFAQDAVCQDAGASTADVGTASGGGNEVACGTGAVASGPNAIAIGMNAVSAHNSTIALGTGASALSTQSIAIGQNAQIAAVAGESIVVGFNAQATGGTRNIALGSGAITAHNGTVAIGFSSQALGQHAVALGESALADVQDATALGFFSKAQAERATAVGQRNIASGIDATAVGSGNTVSGARSTAVGVGNIVSGNGSGAFGDPNNISGNGSYATGNNNTIAQDNTFVVGNTVTTTQANSVVLGNASTDRAATAETGDTINGVFYNYAGVGSAANGVVSVGAVGAERQIINVAAGDVSATSTDAINGSQLFATNQAIAAGQTHYYSVNDGGSPQANYANDGATGLNSLAAGVGTVSLGVGATALGNGAQAIGDESVALGVNASAAGDSSFAFGTGSIAGGNDAISLGTSTLAADGSVALGRFSSATGIQSLALGPDATATIDDGVALGSNSVASTAAGIAGYVPTGANSAQSTAIVATTSTLGAVSVGDSANGIYRQVTGVAAGTADSDAVNVAQLTAVATTASAGWNISAQGANATNVGPNSATGTDVDLSNTDGNIVVAKSTTSNDVTFDLADDITVDNVTVNENLTVLGDTYLGDNFSVVNNEATYNGPITNDYSVVNKKYVDDSITTVINSGAGIKYFHANSTSPDSQALGTDSVAIGPNAVANNAGDIALGSGSSTAAAVATSSGTIGGVTYNYAGAAPTSTVSVGAVGAERTITNVAAGRVSATSTDAVNGSQLDATNQQVTANTTAIENLDGRVTTIEGDITSIKNGTAGLVQQTGGAPGSGDITIGKDTGGTVINVAGTDGDRVITGVAAGNVAADSSDAVNGSQLYQVQQAANAGWNVTTKAVGTGTVSGTTVAKVAPGSTATFAAGNNIAITQNGTETQVALQDNISLNSVTVNSLAVTGGPTIDSNGIDLHGDRITNVGAGVAPTDAVNVSQLNGLGSNILNQANTYTDTQIKDLRFDLGKVGRDARGGTAAAMAMSQIPQAFEPGMGIAGVGVSTWRGEHAIAFGLSKASENGRVVVKVSGTVNSRGHGGAAAGVGFQF